MLPLCNSPTGPSRHPSSGLGCAHRPGRLGPAGNHRRTKGWDLMAIKQQLALRRNALRFAIAGILGTVAAAPTAFAQNEDEVVVITGTRLPAPNLVSTSPIQVVNAEEIKV